MSTSIEKWQVIINTNGKNKAENRTERVRAVITRVSKEMAFEQRPSKMRGQDL